MVSNKPSAKGPFDEYTNLLTAHAVTLGPLVVCFLCFVIPYLRAIDKNLPVHQKSPFLPLITVSLREIRYLYPSFFAAGVLFGAAFMLNDFPRDIFSHIFRLLVIFGLPVNWFVAMYQLAISTISIHRFRNRRKPDSSSKRWDLDDVNILVNFYIGLVVLKDCGLFLWLYFYQQDSLNTFIWVFAIHYIAYQILLFIGTISQFSLKSESYSEKVIEIHIKAIGIVKFILFILTGISLLTGFHITFTMTLFFFIDFLLVPVVIQITEVMTDPNLVPVCEIARQPVQIDCRI
ncbi:unnamed protein product [Caenorhabditis brenneri]